MVSKAAEKCGKTQLPEKATEDADRESLAEAMMENGYKDVNQESSTAAMMESKQMQKMRKENHLQLL